MTSEAMVQVTRDGTVIAKCRTPGSVLPLMEVALTFTRYYQRHWRHKDRLYLTDEHDVAVAFERRKEGWVMDHASRPSTRERPKARQRNHRGTRPRRPRTSPTRAERADAGSTTPSSGGR